MKRYGYYQGTLEQPFHLSVGAVLYNQFGQIAVHYIKTLHLENTDITDFYILMRESVEEGETLEVALHRGLREEFGANGEIEHFLGTQLTGFTRSGVKVEKTTLYFLVKCLAFDEKKRDPNDEESYSTIVWVYPEDLMAKMSDQAKRIAVGAINESEIIQRANSFIKNKRPI